MSAAPLFAKGEHVGKYVIVREIGRGGMGVVFEAWDGDLQRSVALKVLYAELLADPRHAECIVSEARAAAVLSHPNIVRIHALVANEGFTAIDMEYVNGRSLDAILRAGPLGTARTVHILAQVFSALDACHKRGMAHLDLKPSNIVLTAEGHVFLTDFGLARAVAQESVGKDAAPTWGTPRYAPPELWTGAQPEISWDIYSAGVVAIECLAGRTQSDTEMTKRSRHAEHIAFLEGITEVSREMKNLLQRMLAKNPRQRPANAGEALADLRKTPEFVQGKTTEADHSFPLADSSPDEGVTVTVETPYLRRRSKRRVALLALPVLAIGVMAAIYAWSHISHGPVTPPRVQTSSSSPPYSSDPQELTAAGPYVYFSADDGIHGRELWCAGPFPPQRAVDHAPGFTGKSPHALFNASNDLYFCAETPETGPELYRCSDGGAGVLRISLVRDILPGPMGSDPKCIAHQWPTTLLYATTRNEGRELWSTLGTPQETAMVADLFPGPQGSMPSGLNFAVGSGSVCFAAYISSTTGINLCRYQFSDNSIKFLCDVSEDFRSLEFVGDRFLFAQTDKEHGSELWSCEVKTGQTHLLADIAPGPDSSSPGESCVLGNRMLFQATTPGEGAELWTTDGTQQGTKLLKDICPGPKSSKPFGFRAGDTFAFFRADDGVHGLELWASDGTPEGTSMVADMNPGPAASTPYNLAVGKTYTAFSADDGVHGEELWLAQFHAGKWEARMVEDLFPGPTGSEPTDLAWLDGAKAYFVATIPHMGREFVRLWISGTWEGISVTPFDIQLEAGDNPRTEESTH